MGSAGGGACLEADATDADGGGWGGVQDERVFVAKGGTEGASAWGEAWVGFGAVGVQPSSGEDGEVGPSRDGRALEATVDDAEFIWSGRFDGVDGVEGIQAGDGDAMA